jgi:hypothetical protein
MKAKWIIAGICLLTGFTVARADIINIPDGSFQNVNAVINPPLVGIGTTSGGIGAWSAQLSDFLNVGGQIASSNAVSVGWETPPSGSYELRINLPASVESSGMISQVLTNHWQPNSVYTLTVSLSQQSTLNLISGSSLSLYAVSSTNLATINGMSLAQILNSSSGFQTITLTYKTPNSVPTNTIGIAFAVKGVAGIGGNVYATDFQLTVDPIQVQLGSSITVGHHGSPSTITLTGQGGAPGAIYEIISNTNLPVTPLGLVWAPMTTNTFDANGNFSTTITVDRLTPWRFFRVVVPGN